MGQVEISDKDEHISVLAFHLMARLNYVALLAFANIV